MQVRQPAKFEDPDRHGGDVYRECGPHHGGIGAHRIGMEQSNPSDRRQQKQRVSNQVEPRARRRRLAEPACDEPVGCVGQARGDEPDPDQSTVAEQGPPPDNRQHQETKPGDTVRQAQVHMDHERSLARGGYL